MSLHLNSRIVVFVFCLAGLIGCSPSNTPQTPPKSTSNEVKAVSETPLTVGGSLRNFEAKAPRTLRRHTLVQYDIQLKDELFYVYVPENYNGTEAFGILAFIAPSDSMVLPAGWETVLKERKLIYIAPQKAGNTFPVSRRAGLALAGILKLSQIGKIDATRVYVTGLSGGGRVAARLSFFHPELIAGALPCGGADFCEAVPKVHATQADEYGTVSVDPSLASMTRIKVPFALITGDKDQRRGNILDLYEGGFAKKKFRAKLFDVAGAGHEVCSAATLTEALSFVESPSIWNGAGSPVAAGLVKRLVQAKNQKEVNEVATEVWHSDVEADLQRYALSYARLLSDDSRSTQMFELMLSALNDPVPEAKRCCQWRKGNGLMRKRAEERSQLLLSNPRIKDQVLKVCGKS